MNNSYTHTISNNVANDVRLLMSVNIGDKENNYKFSLDSETVSNFIRHIVGKHEKS